MRLTSWPGAGGSEQQELAVRSTDHANDTLKAVSSVVAHLEAVRCTLSIAVLGVSGRFGAPRDNPRWTPSRSSGITGVCACVI